MKITQYLSSLWANRDVPSHIYLKWQSKFVALLMYNCIQKFHFIPQPFVRYCRLKNPVFWLVCRFLDHNTRIKFFSKTRFLQKVRIPLVLSYLNKELHMKERIRFFNHGHSILGLFIFYQMFHLPWVKQIVFITILEKYL